MKKTVYLLVYYQVNELGQLTYKPTIHQCKSFEDAVVKQNHLNELGFKCEAIHTIDIEIKEDQKVEQ